MTPEKFMYPGNLNRELIFHQTSQLYADVQMWGEELTPPRSSAGMCAWHELHILLILNQYLLIGIKS